MTFLRHVVVCVHVTWVLRADPNEPTTKSSQFFDAQALADALRVNKTLTEVALSDNNFGNEGLKARPPQRAIAWKGGIQKRDGRCPELPAQPLCALVETCNFTWVLIEFIHRLIQLLGPGLGHGRQWSHHRLLSPRPRNAQWWRPPGAVAFGEVFPGTKLTVSITWKTKSNDMSSSSRSVVFANSHPELH